MAKDDEEKLAHVRRKERARERIEETHFETWMMFAAAALAGGQSSDKATKTADAMIEVARAKFAT